MFDLCVHCKKAKPYRYTGYLLCPNCYIVTDYPTFAHCGWDRVTFRPIPKNKRRPLSFRNCIIFFQGKQKTRTDHLDRLFIPSDTPKEMLKILRKNDMRDKIDHIFLYRKVVCGETPMDISHLERDLIADYENSGYDENNWYLLYKLLKEKYKVKIKLNDFPNLNATKSMKAEYVRCF